jgi:hypothetical protein
LANPGGPENDAARQHRAAARFGAERDSVGCGLRVSSVKFEVSLDEDQQQAALRWL